MKDQLLWAVPLATEVVGVRHVLRLYEEGRDLKRLGLRRTKIQTWAELFQNQSILIHPVQPQNK